MLRLLMNYPLNFEREYKLTKYRAMELTNKFIEEHGFTKVNNSMWRKGDVTIQNDWITEGNTVYERLFGYKKAYKICLSGKYLQHITTVTDFKVFVCGIFDDACESKCNKHAVSSSVCTCELTHENCDCIDTGICEICNKPISQTDC